MSALNRTPPTVRTLPSVDEHMIMLPIPSADGASVDSNKKPATDKRASIPSSWKRKTIKFRDKHGADIKPIIFNPKEYLRVVADASVDDVVGTLDEFLREKEGWDLGDPKMVVNVIGDIEQSRFCPEFLKSTVKSLFRMTTNTWVLNEGYRTVFNKFVNEAVKELGDECNRVKNAECNVRTTSLGVCTWRNVVGVEAIEAGDIYDVGELSRAPKVVNRSDDWRSSEESIVKKEEKNFLLCENNTHFVAVDVEGRKGADFRKDLFHRIVAPRATLLVGGGRKTLASLTDSLEAGVPCVVVAGSGGLADLLSTPLRLLQAWPRAASPQTVKTLAESTDKVEGLAVNPPRDEKFLLCLTRHSDFVVIDSSRFDEAAVHDRVLAAFVAIPEDRRPPKFLQDFLKLCQSWNRLDHAANALGSFKYMNDSDVVDCAVAFVVSGGVAFLRALVNYKPTLFVLLGRRDFRRLYDSDRIARSVVLHFVREEVVDIHGINNLADQIRLILDTPGEEDDNNENKNNDENNKNNRAKKYRKFDNDTNELTPDFDPRFHLFVWSILYKQYDLADYMWRLCDFPIATGLIASSVLRSLTKLWSTHAESNVERLRIADAYEDRAGQLLTKCFYRSPTRTKFLLLRSLPRRGGLSCLQLATKDDENANFIANPVCIRHLDDIWYRCNKSEWTPFLVSCLIALIFFAFLVGVLVFSISSEAALRRAALTISLLFLFLFFALATMVETRKFYRRSYAELKPVVEEEERLDKEMLEHIDQRESRLLLRVGIGCDVIHDEIHKNDCRPPIKGFLPRLSKFHVDWIQPLLLFLDTPQTKFTLHVCSFSLYLLLFAFLILSAPPDFARRSPSPTEWLVVAYWLSFFAHEFKQFYRGDVESTSRRRESLARKAAEYWDSFWNRVDIFLFLYLVGMIVYRVIVLKVSAANDSQYVFVSVLNLYSLYFVLWCLRMLQIFAVSQSLGPKLIMIRMMMIDVVRILLYIVIFAAAYAVWLKAATRTVEGEFLEFEAGDGGNSSSSVVDFLWQLRPTDVVFFLDDLMSRPFWHLFGESFMDDYDGLIPPENATFNASAAILYRYRYRVNMIKLAVPFVRLLYVLVTVVLLLNLMIAIFQYSIDRVQSQADKNWNIYRRSVIFEYFNRALLPAPLSLLLDAPGFFLFLLNVICRRRAQQPWRVSIVAASERFRCSTLHLRAGGRKRRGGGAGARDSSADEEIVSGPFVDWLKFVENWEKVLQHNFFPEPKFAEPTEKRPEQRTEQRREADIIRMMELKEEVVNLKKDVTRLADIVTNRNANVEAGGSTPNVRETVELEGGGWLFEG